MKKRNHAPRILLATATIALSALASCTSEEGKPEPGSHSGPSEMLEEIALEGVDKLHACGGIFLASQPGEGAFTALKEKGVKTVINLRKPGEEVDFDEAKALEELGLAYVALPWNGPEEMTDELIDESRRLLRDAEKPLVLHCASSNRVGGLWIPYRVLDEGIPLDQAVAEAKQAGLKTAEYETRARAYIEARQ